MQLRIPGPTPLPDRVRGAGGMQMISHRGPEFRAMMRDVTERLQACFQTSGDVLIFPASGTGGLEAAIANTFSAGDVVLAVTVGHFGDRFADIAGVYGLDVKRLEGEWGKAAGVEAAREALDRHPGARGLLLTHNETSTGVLNDVAAFGRLARERDLLLVVDSISGLGAADLQVDAWGVDVAITASQKAWMTPPGLAMISVSEKAWRANQRSTLPRYYWSFRAARKYLDKWETPYTPAVSLLFQLQAALELIMEEGLQNVFKRHELVRDYVRGRARELGLRLLVEDEAASQSLTAVRVEEAGLLLSRLKERGVEVSGGQGPLEDRLVRIAHLGFVEQRDLEIVMDSLESVLDRVPALAAARA